MRVFVTGWDGLVGRELRAALAARGRCVVEGGDLPGFDALRAGQLRRRLARLVPDWVVHLAAWTEVDACESDAARALRQNGAAAGFVAREAARAGARLLLVSTDYVLDGAAAGPAAEDRPCRPLSAYGRSKLAGEAAVRAALAPGRWTIVRGQSLYGAGRKSFPDAILRAAAAQREIPVVTDQVVSPTWARDFAGALVALMDLGPGGVFHAAAAGACTWNEFATATLEEAGVTGVRVVPTTAAALGRPAPRPARSVFDTGKFERATGRRLRPWREMLRAYLRSTGRAA